MRCARFRKESRGLHHSLDWPESRDEFRGDTVLSRFEEPHLLLTDEPIVTEPRLSGRDA